MGTKREGGIWHEEDPIFAAIQLDTLGGLHVVQLLAALKHTT
jgi:hypothetical protein